jgi:hypothetical protein
MAEALGTARDGRPVLVDVAIDYAHKTYFTEGVVRTTFWRLPWCLTHMEQHEHSQDRLSTGRS